MKLRVGFVSNSSSQSFVMLGVDISDINKDALKKKLAEKFNFESSEDLEDVSLWEILEDQAWDTADEGRYLGISIFGFADDRIEEKVFSLVEMKEKIDAIVEFFAELGEPIPEVKIIGGTEVC